MGQSGIEVIGTKVEENGTSFRNTMLNALTPLVENNEIANFIVEYQPESVIGTAVYEVRVNFNNTWFDNLIPYIEEPIREIAKENTGKVTTTVKKYQMMSWVVVFV